MSFVIRGLHPIEAPGPCYLFEVGLSDPNSFDWGSVTQEISGQPSSNWQVAWDERQLDETRWAFFFHYLDLTKPLLTSRGTIQLPDPTPLPTRLEMIKYEPPC
jgi:hypothetical protein